MTIDKILIVDDELLIRSFLGEALGRKGYEVTLAKNGKEALAFLKEKEFDLVITDMMLPDLTGMQILTKTKALYPNTPIIVITAHGTVENAVEAMRKGAFNYLLKPFTPDSIEALIAKANEHVALVAENTFLKQEHTPHKAVAESPVMKKILKEALQVANSHASVLIQGESGTGKEVLAQLIHSHSPRKNRPYIRVNCAAIPDTLIESEFFGHEKGAFTGANSKRLGRFELANGGSLLLDEVTEIPLNLQPKLLRVIQEQEFERVGGSRAVKVDVRLISTTNRVLKEAIEEKIFREDLYYRLNVIPLHLPPLRQRKEDIVPLAKSFLKRYCQDNHRAPKTLSQGAIEKLLEYNWPGNIRELANIMERVVVLDQAPKVEAEHLFLDALTPC